jgi:hypothetical protein
MEHQVFLLLILIMIYIKYPLELIDMEIFVDMIENI